MERGAAEEDVELSKHQVLSYGFNQDTSCCCLSTRSGFFVYTCMPRCELRLCDASEGIRIVEMLYSTSLMGLVGSGDTYGSTPRKLRLWSSQTASAICEMNFISSILSVKMNRERVVVCLEEQLHIFDVPHMKCLQTLTTPKNPSGLIALSREGSSFIAFPSRRTGEVVIYDAISLRLLSQVPAHVTALAAVEFSHNLHHNHSNPHNQYSHGHTSSVLMATASEHGTVVRVFSAPTGEHLYTLRRGSTPSRIFSLSFLSGYHPSLPPLLAVGASSGTIHIFSLDGYRPGPNTNTHARTHTYVQPAKRNSFSRSASPRVHRRVSQTDACGEDDVEADAHSHRGASDTSSQGSASSGGAAPTALASVTSYVQGLWGHANGSRERTASESQGHGVNSSSGKWRIPIQLQRSAEAVTNAVGAIAGGLLPKAVQEFAESSRSIAQARVPDASGGFKASLVTTMLEPPVETTPSSADESHSNTNTNGTDAGHGNGATAEVKLVVITSKGYFYRFDVTPSLTPTHEPAGLGSGAAVGSADDSSAGIGNGNGGMEASSCRLEEETLLDMSPPLPLNPNPNPNPTLTATPALPLPSAGGSGAQT